MTAPLPLTTPAALSQCLAELAGTPCLALDTEFRREDTYFPELCLVQLATPDGLWLIDPLAMDLAPLWTALTQSPTPIVLHAAQQDLELIALACGALPPVLRDTQIAAALLGLGDQIGYAQLVSARLGISLDKSQSRTDWTARPLSLAQRQYAADDVRHLSTLYPGLLDTLQEKGRLAWFEAECAELSDTARFAPRTTGLWRKVSGHQALRPPERAVLEAIAHWRETQAIARNTPRRWILSDDTAIKLAANPQPKAREIIAGRHGVPHPSDAERHALLTAMADARQTPAECWPRTGAARLSPAEQSRLHRWQNRLSALSLETGISPSLLATTDDLVQLLQHPQKPNRLTHGWRAPLIGEALQSLF